MRSIRALSFEGETVTFAWVDLPQGLRENGLMSAQLVVPRVDEMTEALDRLEAVAEDVLGEAIEFFRGSEQVNVERSEDDEQTSPYDNPAER